MTPSVRHWGVAIGLLVAGLTARAWDLPNPTAIQASVRPGGFATISGPAGSRVVTQYDRRGQRVAGATLDVPAASRVVGMKGGLGVISLDDKVRVGHIVDGELRPGQAFGTDPLFLCDGASSSNDRFAVGWVERDQKLWFVYGPGPSETITTATTTAMAPETSWCTITPSGKQLAILARVGDTVSLNTCDRRCGMLVKLAVDVTNKAILDAGCVDAGCALATSDGTVTWVARAGKRRWVKALPDGARDPHAALLGVTKHVYVAYETARGLAIAKLGPNGAFDEIWQGRGTRPSLAWSNGALFLGYRDVGDDPATIVLAVAN